MITESDVLFAAVSRGLVVGFNVKVDNKGIILAREEGVDIRLYNIIYELIDEVAKLAQGLVVPKYQEQIIGKGQVIKVFHIPDIGTVPGCLVQEGKFIKGYKARVIRKGIVLYTGEILSLKHYDVFVNKIGEGYTCGILLSGGFKRYRTKDQIEVFIRTARKWL